jgi:uncharacterized protein YigE (DUF2233 family)
MGLKPIFIVILAVTLLTTAGCGLSDYPSQGQDSYRQTGRTGQTPGFFENEDWKEAAPGLAYRYYHIDPGNGDDLKDFFTVRIDPKKYAFEVYQNRDQETAITIGEIHKETGSLLTFNGGFFTEDFKPTGLLISNGEKIRVASTASLLDGIFAIGESGGAKLFGNKDPIDEKKYTFAIQNGPVLLDDGGKIMIDEETGKTASRTAIGLDEKGNIILVILKQSLFDPSNHITLYEFARMLKESPGFREINLHSVLNLDGGASTGLMVDGQYFPELDRVQNVVIVKERQV